MDTETKLNTLKRHFPSFDEGALLDILVSCNGSVETAKILLSEDQNEKIISNLENENNLVNEVKSEVEKPENPDCNDNLATNGTKRTIGEAKLINQTSLSSLLKVRKLNPTDTRKTITLYTKEDIESNLSNIRIFPNFLPTELNDQVASSLMSQKMLFKAKQFYIAGNLCTSSQKSIFYSNDGQSDYDPVYASADMRVTHFTNELLKCKVYVDSKVNEVLKEYTKTNSLPEYAIKQDWKSDFCVGNYYPDKKSHLDLHSDKLTNLGPLPTIASLTIGATRIFRLRRSFPSDSVIFDIPVPDNTLIIMLPGTQELFKHGVPTLKNSFYKKSDKMGDIRFNLTYRMAYPPFNTHKVCCDICKKRMILRRLFKGPDIGYYVWMCMSSFKGTNCTGFKYADFSMKDGKMNVSTDKKSEATRWLSDSETDLNKEH